MFSFVENKGYWNKYIIENGGRFLQSFEWGEFQKAHGRKVWRLALVENGKIIYGWQVIEMGLPWGLRYWYVARPILVQSSKFKVQSYSLKLKNFIYKVVELAKKDKAVFIRVDGVDNFEIYGFRKVNVSVQPQEELALDITKTEEELLAEMKPKTRYNIRVAEKHGVKISSKFPAQGWSASGGKVQSSKFLEDFWELIQKTGERQGIRPHPKAYYEKMIEILGENNIAKLSFAEYQNKIIAAIFIIYFGNTATYLHGASDDDCKNLMAPYLLHWQAIQEAKNAGYKFYNFGGVSNEKKSWEGITRFKTGFSPETKFMKYGGVCDLPINNLLYRLYKWYKKF